MSIFIQFWSFLLLTYLLPLFVVAVGNVIAGSAEALVTGDFKWAKALEGLRDLLALAIGYITLGAFAFVVKDVTLVDVQVFSGLFAFLTILVIVIKGNSLAMHFITLAKIPVPAVMNTFDNKVKELLGKEQPEFLGITTEDEEGVPV